MKKPKILLIGSSIRSIGDLSYLEEINKGLCNSEIALASAYHGIKEYTSDIEYQRLNNSYFPDLIDKIKEADGIIFGTPVYFGHRNSLLDELISFIPEGILLDKVCGVVSVGAKRNGGQETTNVFTMWDLMGKGALCVNDGAPISQFGGTGIAGKLGDMKKDKTGLEQCFGLGQRVAHVADIIKQEKYANATITRIDVPRTIAHGFDHCRGCAECPLPIEKDYKCRNTEDYMGTLHKEIVKADGLHFIGFSMRLFERMRYLRRDNFRLTYTVVHCEDVKQVPIFIKLNTILCRNNLDKYAMRIKGGLKKVSKNKQKYEAIGH